jgi:DNA-binding transcriptional LysR family regulator
MALCAARMMLQPLILEYVRRYPRMEVEIITEAALVDVIGRGGDAGVRPQDRVPPDMIAVPIFSLMREIVVASPSYLKAHGVPAEPRDLLQHECIRARMPSGRIYHWEFSRDDQSLALDVPGRLLLDDTGLMLDAALGSGKNLGVTLQDLALPS